MSSNDTSHRTQLSLKKKLLFACVPAIAIVLLLFICTEIALRIQYKKIEQLTGVAEWETASFLGLTYHWDIYHPRRGWTNLPGYRSDARVPFRVTINGQGLRGSRDYPENPPPGVTRIAMIGDSCTFGEEVDDDQTLPFHLETMLADTEVLNFGVHGYGLGEMALQLEDVFAFKPNIILLVLTLPSDFGRTVQTHFVHPKPAFAIQDEKLVLLNTPVPVASSLPWCVRHSFTAAWLWGRHAPVDVGNQVSPFVSMLLLKQIKEKCAARNNTPLMVVSISGPDWTRATEGTAGYIVTEGCRGIVRDSGLPLSDKVDFLRQIQKADPSVVSYTGIHWGNRGNYLLAESLARDVHKQFPTIRLRNMVP